MRHVLIADDHAVTRRGLREILLDAFDGVNVEEVGDGDAALARLDTRPWDLILLDVMMPGPGILGVLARIRAFSPTLPVLVLTGTTEVQYVVETMRAGANGLIHKHHAADDLLRAIQQVADGGTYLHADTAVAVAKSLRSDASPARHQALSERELEVLCRIARGQSIKAIAFDLGLSGKTVATYLVRIRDKTGLAGHVEIARYALREGLVD